MCRFKAAALIAACLFTFAQTQLFAGNDVASEKLPEPAHRFAKEATLRVTEMEREWAKLAERLSRCQGELTVADRAYTEDSLRQEASRLLSSGAKLLADQRELSANLERFKDALKKAASHYREVANLYRGHAGAARSEEVKGDYLELAKSYERKADNALERSRKLSMPLGVSAKAEVVAEGNLFVERLIEALGIGQVTDLERSLTTERLKKQSSRCKALAEALSKGIQEILLTTDSAEIKRSVSRNLDRAPALARASPTWPRDTVGAEKGGIASLLQGSWSTPITISGVRYLQILRFTSAGSCVQSIYHLGPNGKGALVAITSVTCDLDASGVLSCYKAGKLIERGRVSLFERDQWSYEILENRLSPAVAGTRLTFIREP